MSFELLVGAAVAVLLSALPVALGLWALLDAARRPAWAWSLAGRSQVIWLAGIGFSIVFLPMTLLVSPYYLLRIRPKVAGIEHGNLTEVIDPETE